MPLDRKGAAFAASKEGLYLYTYADPATGGEPWTIGIGHTAAAGGMKPKPGDRVTIGRALAMLIDDTGRNETRVRRAIRPSINQDELNGFISFDLNTGAIATGSVDDKWNRGDRAAAMATLKLYVNAAGRRFEGLATRRREEAAIILRGEYPARMMVTIKDRPGSAGRSMAAELLPWDAPADPPPQIGDDFLPKPASVPVPEQTNGLWDLAKWIWKSLNAAFGHMTK